MYTNGDNFVHRRVNGTPRKVPRVFPLYRRIIWCHHVNDQNKVGRRRYPKVSAKGRLVRNLLLNELLVRVPIRVHRAPGGHFMSRLIDREWVNHKMFALKQTVGFHRNLPYCNNMHVLCHYRLLSGHHLVNGNKRVQIVMNVINRNIPLDRRTPRRLQDTLRVIARRGRNNEYLILFRHVRGEHHVTIFMPHVGNRMSNFLSHIPCVVNPMLHRNVPKNVTNKHLPLNDGI